jgi:glycine oxidase
MPDVIVVGGGVIGLSIAHAAAARGRSVTVLDPGDPANAASWAAAGMLAPLSEAEHPDPLFELCEASLRLYRCWAGRLQTQSGIDPEYDESGLLCLANSKQALNLLKKRMSWHQAAGFTSELLTPEDIRRLEPNLTLDITGGLYMPGEFQVRPRRLLEALRTACSGSGVEIQSGQRVRAVLFDNDHVAGVETESGKVAGDCVVIASGVRSTEILGLRPRLRMKARKGQMLSLMAPMPLFRHLIRWEDSYMVQRKDGELVVGATNEDTGLDRSITPAGIGGLLERAQQISSHTASFAIREMWTGLRPATPDGLPVLGHAATPGLIYATGHYRNGILLAPITASIVTALIEKEQPPLSLDAFAAARFDV